MENPDDSLPVVEIKVNSQRDMNMALARLGGATYKQIGDEWGLSRQRVQQILSAMELDLNSLNLPRFGMADSENEPCLPVAWPKPDNAMVRRNYFGPGRRIFKERFPTFKGALGKSHRRKDVQVLRELRDKLGRMPYPGEVAKEQQIAWPTMALHWVSRKQHHGKGSYKKYRNRMYIAAFGWGTKAPDGRSYLAALAQQAKDQDKWLTA